MMREVSFAVASAFSFDLEKSIFYHCLDKDKT
jgi:hypothetical protein